MTMTRKANAAQAQGKNEKLRTCKHINLRILRKWQFAMASDSGRSMIVGVHPQTMPSSATIPLIFSFRFVVVTINFKSTGSISVV